MIVANHCHDHDTLAQPQNFQLMVVSLYRRWYCLACAVIL